MVFDHFHVIKLLNDTINRIRLEEARENGDLKRTKFLWLTNPENLTERQERMLLHVKDLDIKTAKAYQFKLAIQRVWDLPPHQAREYLKKWIAWADGCNLPEMANWRKAFETTSMASSRAYARGSPLATPRASTTRYARRSAVRTVSRPGSTATR